ncbi:MAG: hypothetical protein ABUL73_01630 [Alphaproteobacteria bacterium]
MRRAVFVGLIAAALAACSPPAQKGETPNAQTAPAAAGATLAGAFPNLFQTSYRAEATRTGADGSTRTMVIVRDGRRTRIERTDPVHGDQIVINNPDAHEMLMIMDRGGQKMAIRSTSMDMDDVVDQWRTDAQNAVHATGPCSGAGEIGTQWTRQDADGKAHSVCITSDGIILNAAENGQTTWQTTRIQRGPQDPALFAAPAGIRVMNLNAGASALLERLRAAKKP